MVVTIPMACMNAWAVIGLAKGKAIVLKASHPTFHVATPTLVFRCIGDGIEVDDIKVRNAGN